MRNVNILNYTTKVNKVAYGIMCFTLISSIGGTVASGQIRTLDIMTNGLVFFGIIISLILMLKKVTPVLISWFILLDYSIFTALACIYDPSSAGMTILQGLCISALFLNKTILLNFAVLNNILLIVPQLLFHNFEGQLFIFTFIIVEATIVILFFMCKWGNELIQSAIQKEEQANKLLDSLNNVMKVIQANTSLLNYDISSCNMNIGALKEISNSIEITVQEITKGVMEQAESINDVSEMMNSADEKMSEINNLSKYLADTSGTANKIVNEGAEEITNMGKQIEIINIAVSESLTTVQELNNSMDDINKFLSGITQISEQTNLLALNAAIEAARAGEQGKGFAVVAEEVRKLAEQSSNTVSQIDEIITEIKGKTKTVLEKVNSGSIAVREGKIITSQVNEGFEKIKLSFKNIDEYILNELKMVENVDSIFVQIRERTESIASISEEHSAATEEILGTAEEQNASIESIYELMKNINNSSIKLQELVERK